MSLAEIVRYSYDDYKSWEGDWELIDGYPIAISPAPTKKHQIVSGNIYFELKQSLKDCKECEALYEVDWKIDNQNVVRPDILVVCNDNSANYITKTPKIIAEIISPSTVKIDEQIKFEIYQKEGVKYYILVYPYDLIAKVYELKNGKFIKVGDFDEELVEFNNFECNTKIDFKEVFKRLRK